MHRRKEKCILWIAHSLILLNWFPSETIHYRNREFQPSKLDFQIHVLACDSFVNFSVHYAWQLILWFIFHWPWTLHPTRVPSSCCRHEHTFLRQYFKTTRRRIKNSIQYLFGDAIKIPLLHVLLGINILSGKVKRNKRVDKLFSKSQIICFETLCFTKDHRKLWVLNFVWITQMLLFNDNF